ncbi:transcriptional regulator with XRE-family HTH domain/tetratricopeptide (TPR) repeat protein [Micromonospora sp. A200]|uniref:helix-turn-helix domain-containing protein n=1 Tax=Micromonospora sp. A200 TaxID=2940568 RepID=UPI0024756A45|nr:tetratricopeptide repeat protein [Micromonospora sp. A200]MDH6466344.1 transcriptional regulator with XRE-family HTH domain/tetratricopeptide (TPR) repeat protein [Micromonospora sp. A200]
MGGEGDLAGMIRKRVGGVVAGSSFGQRLREFRQSAGMTIEDLSEASGVSGRAISDMERGHSRAPQERTLAAVADALKLSDGDRAGLVELARSERSESRVGRPRVGELPRGASDFVGRARELELLHRHALAASVGGPTPVAVVHGQPGLGKTAFAVRAAEQLREGFPDGQFYLDLRGTDPVPTPVGEALTRLLRALGVNPRRIADDEQERASQLRAILAERRCLLVLDNAADEGQVRPLLPGLGAGMVVVTSRRLLGGLEGVLRIGLAPLTSGESAALLRAIVGEASDRAAEQELRAVVRLCGHLPLALRIAGTRLASRPGWTMGHLAERLSDADRRLANLSVGDLGVAAAFELSYAQLSNPAKAMFRRLAHVPGVDFAAPIAAVLTQVELFDAEDQLAELVDLGLLQPEGFDRYRFHDLIRLFAADRLRGEEPAEARAGTERRMVDWLLETAIVAGRWFEPGFGAPPDDWQGLVSMATPEEAQSWLQVEADNCLAALRSAAAADQHQQVVDVAEAMHWYSDRRVHWGHWPEVYRLSRVAAARLPDRRQEITHINYYAWAVSTCERRYEESAALAMEAYGLAGELGDTKEQANALHHTARAWRMGGNFEKAMEAAYRGLDLADAVGNHDGYVQIRVGLGQMFMELGRFDEALNELRGVLREVDARPVAPAPAQVARMSARTAMAKSLAEAKRWPEALDEATRALPLAADYGPRVTGRVHLLLGLAHSALGATDKARDHLTRAVKLLEDGGEERGPAKIGITSVYALPPQCTRILCEVDTSVWAWHRGIASHAHLGVHCAHQRAKTISLAKSELAALDA